jgi:hypothetical protein
LEQDNLYRQINFKLDVGDPSMTAVRTTFLPVFFCPSDEQVNFFTVTDGGSNSWDVAQASYVACNGNDGVDDFTTPPHTGPFLRAIKGFRAADIVDGLSNTLFVGDRWSKLSYCTWAGGPTGALNPFLMDPGNFGAEVTLLMCHAGPTGPNTPGVFDADSTSSPHHYGVPFAFGDGSVHLLANGIDIPTWMAPGHARWRRGHTGRFLTSGLASGVASAPRGLSRSIGMSQRRVIYVFLAMCFLPILGCTLSTPARKVHLHGARINISDFINHTAAYKGKTITLILKLDQSSSKTSQTDNGGREFKFTTLGPKGEHLNIIITVPQDVSLPDVGPSDDVMVTFVCSQGSLRQGNHAKAVQIPDGTEDD